MIASALHQHSFSTVLARKFKSSKLAETSTISPEKLCYPNTLEIFYGLKLVTTHNRDDTPYGYTQKSSHNLPGHHGSYEKDLDEIYQRAAAIDNIVLVYLKEVATVKRYPPLAFRACRGILSLEKKFGLERLVAACACASQGRRYGYNEVLEILEHGDDLDFMPSADTAP